MFQAVRNFFAASSSSAPDERKIRKTKRLAGLFLFEFVVVVTGVLVAQMLQEAVADRRARGDARMAIERAKQESANFRATANFWLLAAACLSNRMDQLMLAAAQGSPVAGRQVERPRIPFSTITPWTEATTLAARRAYGEELVSDFADISVMADNMRSYSRDLSGDWALLSLLDPALGPVSREDRVNARLAAARIKAMLAGLAVTANNVVQATDRQRISASPVRTKILILPSDCAGGSA